MFKIKDKINQLFFKKKIIVIFSLIIVIVLLVFVKLTQNPLLTIKVTPSDSNIQIIGEGYEINTKNTFKDRIKKGSYKVRTDKDQHITDEREIFVDKDMKIEVSLIRSLTSDLQKTYQTKNIPPIFSKDGFQQKNIYGIDKRSGKLINFEDGVEKVVYNGQVKDFNIGTNKAVVLDKDNLNEIIIINLNTLAQSRIPLDKYAPVISVSISKDESEVYFLADFTILNKKSNLYRLPLKEPTPTKVIETTAQSVRYLKDQKILLFEENHDEDENRVFIYSLDSNTILKTMLSSNYQISPNTTKILIQRSNSIEILDVDSLKSNISNIQAGSRSIWKDESLAVNFRNSNGNILFSMIQASPFGVTPQKVLLENISLLNVFGFIDNELYIQDYEENIFSIDFSKVILE